MEVAQLALSTAMAPLRGKHHQVERADDLDLEPRPSATARDVVRIERLGHDALVSAADRLVHERVGLARAAAVTMCGTT